MIILTDAKGRPFDRPEPLGPNATSEDRVRYLEARNAYANAVADCANRAFDKGLRDYLKKTEKKG